MQLNCSPVMSPVPLPTPPSSRRTFHQIFFSD